LFVLTRDTNFADFGGDFFLKKTEWKMPCFVGLGPGNRTGKVFVSILPVCRKGRKSEKKFSARPQTENTKIAVKNDQILNPKCRFSMR